MSNKINTLKNAITNYIEIDQEINKIEKVNENYITRLKDKIKELENPIKDLKAKKASTLEYILAIMEENKIKNKSLKIKLKNNNYILRCEKEEKKESLTQKFIKETLIKYHKENNFNRLSDTQCEKKGLEEFQFLLDSRNLKESMALVYDIDKK
tara:strand:- start:6118 stop:6579 length:462 start_codon:yes stop_codon:yes gene_type:complete